MRSVKFHIDLNLLKRSVATGRFLLFAYDMLKTVKIKTRENEMTTFVFVLIIGVVLGIIVSTLPFVDFLSMLSKIFPNKMPSDYKEYKKQ